MKLLLAAGALAALAAGSAKVAPVHFRASGGWYASAVCGRPDCRFALSRAATVRWRDCWNCIPPHRTVAALRPDGIAIELELTRPFHPAWGRLRWPPRITRKRIVWLEGVPMRFGGFIATGRLRGLDVTVWIYFGRRQPTVRQMARAEHELRTARLPDTRARS
jgi:hypothetical protein